MAGAAMQANLSIVVAAIEAYIVLATGAGTSGTVGVVAGTTATSATVVMAILYLATWYPNSPHEKHVSVALQHLP